MLCTDFEWGFPEPMETPSLCPWKVNHIVLFTGACLYIAYWAN